MAVPLENTLYVTGLPKGCTDDQVKDMFSRFSVPLSVKVLSAHPGKSDVAAIISMESAEKAKWVIDNVSGTTPEGLTAPIVIKPKSKGWWTEPAPIDSIYVTGLPAGSNEDQVRAVFAQYGALKSVKVLPAQAGKEEIAAIVSLESPEVAKTLIESISGTVPQGLSQPITIKAKMSNWGKGFGKGGFGFNPAMWFGGGRGGLRNFPAEKKVWIGGLPEGVTFSEIQEHFGGSAKAKFAAVLGGTGATTGGVGFGTPEEASAAINSLNGSVLKGATIVVDVWTKKGDGPTDL